MKRRLRNRLLVVFLAATVVPLGLTLWISIELLNSSLDLNVREIDQLSQSLELLGRKYYRQNRDALRADAAAGRAAKWVYRAADLDRWPADAAEFWTSGTAERFQLSTTRDGVLEYMRRERGGVVVYSRDLGIGMHRLSDQYKRARAAIVTAREGNLHRGFVYTLIAVCSTIWFVALGALVYLAYRISDPVQKLTAGLAALAAGDMSARVDVVGQDEIGTAVKAFNDMADQLQQSREKLIHVTRLASWQALARKTAHEVKNSLTPIRLTMEEMIARSGGSDLFLEQAAQIVVDEVIGLEKRVRAFSELAAEPPVSPEPLDVNAIVEERVSFLRSAHPEVSYDLQLSDDNPAALADRDLVKGALTNLMANAADAVGSGGAIAIKTASDSRQVAIEIHDSGPGLNHLARTTLFEPTISFKKGGMGLGLSIARKSVLLCGGDIGLIDGDLGGAAFRVTLPALAEVPAEIPVGEANVSQNQ
jgi:nitrogen fixation/metabolism regulation signal transduction histidine kinase